MARQEYMAGMLRVLILSELAKNESYGYGIANDLEAASGGQLRVRPESLYPVLHRMQVEGHLLHRWIEADNGRPRKIYSITPKGRKAWEKARGEFINQSLAALKALGVTATVKTATAAAA